MSSVQKIHICFLFCKRYFKRSKNLDSLEIYIRAIKIGDWFVLYQMSKNLNRRFFYDFLLALAKEYEVNPDAIETPFIIGKKKNHFKKKIS